MKIQQKKIGGGSGRGRVGGGVQGGCGRRIEVFGKIHKNGGGGGRFWGVRVGGSGSGWM